MSVFGYFCGSNFGQARFLEYRLKPAEQNPVEKVCVLFQDKLSTSFEFPALFYHLIQSNLVVKDAFLLTTSCMLQFEN